MMIFLIDLLFLFKQFCRIWLDNWINNRIHFMKRLITWNLVSLKLSETLKHLLYCVINSLKMWDNRLKTIARLFLVISIRIQLVKSSMTSQLVIIKQIFETDSKNSKNTLIMMALYLFWIDVRQRASNKKSIRTQMYTLILCKRLLSVCKTS